MHFAAQNDQDLVEQVQQHRDQYHTDITDDQIKELAATSAYDEWPRLATVHRAVMNPVSHTFRVTGDPRRFAAAELTAQEGLAHR